MKISDIVWLQEVLDKLAWKHDVAPLEVEEIFDGDPRVRFTEKGQIKGEDVYTAYGQTEAGRYLMVIYIHKKNGDALIS
jgi:hypothetical protein